uniref:S9 family peptidase n=1 Tax=Pseudopedobacter sp. TaxID=1936787 RepID=UPI0033415782
MLKAISKIAGMLCIPAFVLSISTLSSLAQDSAGGYQKPAQEIQDLIDNAIHREVILNNSGDYMVVLERNTLVPISEIRVPAVKLAGERLDGKGYNLKHKFYTSISIKNLEYNEEIRLSGLPDSYKISNVTFSPDQTIIAFCLDGNDGLELWTASLVTYNAKRISDLTLNNTLGRVYQWAPDNQSILAKFKVNRQPNNHSNIVSPISLESREKALSAKLYLDLLNSTADEDLLDQYFTAQLKTVYLNGDIENFASPAIYKDFDFSPDGNFVMTSTLEKPYPYTVPLDKFPFSTDIYDKQGKLDRNLSKTPVQDNLPIGFDAVITAKRAFQWRHDKPQTYVWVEAQDEGNPNFRVAVRDIIYTQDMDDKKPDKLADCYLRFKSIVWGDDHIAIVTERWWKTRTERRVFIKPANSSYRVNLWDRYYEDRYSDPGYFLTTKNEYNKDVLLLEANQFRRLDPSNVNIFSISDGASVNGDRPFLLKFNVKTKITDTLFRSKAPYYEKPVHYNNGKLVFSRESFLQPADYFYQNIKSKKEYQVSSFTNPYLPLNGVTKRILNYKRMDGLKLSSTIYLPKDYGIDKGRIPVIVWAYPREYKTPVAAATVKGSPFRSPDLTWNSPVYWVTQGYAVLEMDMPIVGESNDMPNDTFLEQLKQNAVAAIDEMARLQIADRNRLVLGGQGYGAFMTANMLTHYKGYF